MIKLGGDIRGKTGIAGIQNTLQGGEVSLKRKILRKAYGVSKVEKPLIGPFRIYNFSGDPLFRENSSCGGPNQINDTHVNRKKIGDNVGFNGCDGTNIQIESGNSKFVANSSDFTRFKNLYNTNKVYNYIETTKK